MATDAEIVSDEFSDVACQLLKEYSAELDELRRDSIQILDAFHLRDKHPEKTEREYLARRLQNNRESLESRLGAFETLVRKASQWIQHAQQARPGRQLELEVRLEDFESRLENLSHFLDTNHF